MKRLKRNPAKFESLKLFDVIGREEGYTFKGKKSSENFLNKIKEELKQAKKSPTTLHGLHVETMFGYLAAILGKCSLVKKEDVVEIYSKEKLLEIPDFRVVLEGGQEFLIEVKNYYQKDPSAPYSLKYAYLESLRNYANLVKKDLKIAIYWAKWNIWTLLPEKILKDSGASYSISMTEAYMANEMYLLGDCKLATKPPLGFRIIIDKSKARSVRKKGDYHSTREGVEIYCGDTRIEGDFEQKLALYFIFFGDWKFKDTVTKIANSELTAVEFISEPAKRTPDQEFEMLGFMSSMFSRFYRMFTTTNGNVERISPKNDLGSFPYSIFEDYKGKYLPLWRFNILPKDKD